MKKTALYFILPLGFFVFILTSCNNQPKAPTRDDAIEEFRTSLSAQDTTTMLNLCNAAMEQLQQGKVDDMLKNLYEFDDSTRQLSQLTDATMSRYKRQFQRFPVKEYELQYYSVMLEGCNDVKYKVTFATADQTGGEPATTMYMFNPVKINGEWKLCVKTQHDEFDQELY